MQTKAKETVEILCTKLKIIREMTVHEHCLVGGKQIFPNIIITDKEKEGISTARE